MLGLQLFLPSEFRLFVNLLWILIQLLLYFSVVILGGWKAAYLFAYLLLFKLLLPLMMITFLTPSPNLLFFSFVVLAIVLIGTILLSILGWKLARYFSDPHLIQGGSILGIMGGTIWLIVLAILWIYLATL